MPPGSPDPSGAGVPRHAASVATQSCDHQAGHVRAVEEIHRRKERIAALLADAKQVTEREVLACGNALSTLVDTALALIAESERSAAASVARSEEVASGFVGAVQDDILAQQAAVDAVLRCMDGIDKAVKEFEVLSQDSEILALNVAIEAARTGANGRGFTVIADYMRELADTIRVGADSVRTSTLAVRQALPPVEKYANSIHDRARTFIGVMAEQVRSASGGDDASESRSGRLDAVVELSNTAFSHLQFQDPVIQQLLTINGDLDQLEERVRRALSGELGNTPDDAAPGAEGPVAAAPGDLILF